MDVKGKELQIIALIVAIAMFFSHESKAEEAKQTAKFEAAGQDATCITACPTCTIYTHPIKGCRDSMLLEYKAQHIELLKYLEKKVKVQSEQRSTSN